ncbi:MAG TPA: ATP-binding protein [Vicinamibacterales bacterium]|nr:ATP-binding protein [Vicinamibacterales bacterium]
MAASLRAKLLWVITARAAAITVVLGSAILLEVAEPGTVPGTAFFALIGVTYALTVVYVLSLNQAERRPWVVQAQFAADALLVSALVHLTGGVASYFTSLYVLPIIAAAVTESRRGGFAVALLSALMFGGAVVVQYAGPFGPAGTLGVDPEAAVPPLRVALFTLGLNLFGFFAVALLSGYLAEGLRRADARLAQASSRIADLEAFNRHVIDSLTSGLATADADGRILTFNRAAEAITGLPAAEARGRPLAEVLQLPADLREALASGRYEGAVRAEYAFGAGGRSIELGVSLMPLRTPGGVAGHILTFQDVTEARRREREARAQQRLAAVGEMAAGMAHEIRNPLASMAGSLQILRQELPLSDEQAQLMDIVLRESERLNETISSFLAYARPRRGELARVDVARLVRETAALLRHSTECTQEHEIVVEAPDEPVWYLADEGQLRQILWNLASNGLRAMPRGGRLRLGVAREPWTAGDGEPGVVLRVDDEGVGIPADELDRIFQPFRGAFARGTGLGLAIVHRLVSDYGGRVDVDSRPGTGTTVTVRLPGRPVPVAAEV